MRTELFEMVDMDYLFTVVTADRAVEYTGKEVYVADSIKSLENVIKDGTTRTLEGINSNLCELRFNVHNNDCTTSAYALCIPADKVKRTVAFANELKMGINLGDTVYIRGKDWDNGAMHLVFNGTSNRDGVFSISFGSMCMTAQEWFDKYEWSTNGDKYHPIGTTL